MTTNTITNQSQRDQIIADINSMDYPFTVKLTMGTDLNAKEICMRCDGYKEVGCTYPKCEYNLS